MKNKINLKGLGIKQLSLLKRMNKENLKIVWVKDAYKNKMYAELRTQDDNDILENLSLNFVDSIGKRQIFTVSHWMPSIRMEFTTLLLKSDVVNFLNDNSVPQGN